MIMLRASLEDYLSLRRSLGFKFHSEGIALASFVAFMEQAKADWISVDLALAWAKTSTSIRPGRWAQRLSYIRGFARFCSAIDGRTEVPAPGLLPFCHHRPSPYFFTDDHIDSLLRGVLELPAKDALANHSLYCLFGLLSVSGLRICEALNLTATDVDLGDGILTIRSAKFGKSRKIPLHATTVKALADYQERRDQFLGGRQASNWFVNAQGTRLGYDVVLGAFHRLTQYAGLPTQLGRSRPRLHDLRHRFALKTLLNWYRDELDVEQRLPVLSAFLGHVEVNDTYWYLSACPELLGAAKARLERHWEQLS